MTADAQLAADLEAQVRRVDERVRGGGAVYAEEREQVRAAAAHVWGIVRNLALGRYLGSLTPDTGKPQFVLRFATARHGIQQVVLKVYGQPSPGEAHLQRLWHQHGVPTVPILEAGDSPVSWLLMPYLRVANVSVATDVDSRRRLTKELASVVSAAHELGAGVLARSPSPPWSQPFRAEIGRHLSAVILALKRHGYAVPHWKRKFALLSRDTVPTLLHGDLAPDNVVRELEGGRLLLLDACAYVGPAEFDAARWAARVGGAALAPDLLTAWLDCDAALEPARANAWLGFELLMEAGVREIVKAEQGRPNYPDSTSATTTTMLLGRAQQLLVEL